MRQETTFTQAVAAATWTIHLTEGINKTSVAVEVIRDNDGVRLFPDNDRIDGDNLVLHFGLDEHAGTVRYSWLDDTDDPQTITSGTNTVTINVTQNGGTAPEGETF
jgi:hypothetical protein